MGQGDLTKSYMVLYFKYIDSIDIKVIIDPIIIAFGYTTITYYFNHIHFPFANCFPIIAIVSSNHTNRLVLLDCQKHMKKDWIFDFVFISIVSIIIAVIITTVITQNHQACHQFVNSFNLTFALHNMI